jgi:hypothetical protein
MKFNPAPEMRILAYVVGVVGTFLIVALLIGIMYYYTQPPPVDQARAAERKKNLADLSAQSKDQLENYGWIDQTKGVVRLPIAQAMAITVREWQNPVAARTNLIARVDKAFAPPPTNAVPEKNPYE